MKKFTAFETQLGESVVLTDKAKLSLYKKSQNSGYSIDILEEVYRRGHSIWNETFGGTPDSFAFDRVNSFISGGFAEMLDEDLINEKRGLWDNIHAKRARIKAGSGERMRKPGSEGAPTDAALKASQNEDTDPCWKGYKQVGMKKKNGKIVPNCVPTSEDAEAHSKDFTKPSSRFIGSDELTDIYKQQTPGQIIKRVVKEHLEEDAATIDAMSHMRAPQIERPGYSRPAPQRQFSRSVTTTGRMGSGGGAQSARVQVQRAAPARPISARMNTSQGGSMSAQVQTQRAAPMRGVTSTMPSRGSATNAMSAKPTVSTGGMNKSEFMGRSMASKMGDGLDSVSRNMSKGFAGTAEKAAGSVAGRAAGGLLRTALGPAGAAAAAVMEPTPAGEKMSEFQRQDTLKKYNPFKSQGRSIEDYEKQQVTRKSASAPTAAEAPKPEAPKVTADVPTPPSRPKYMEDPLKTVHTKGGDYPVFKKGGESSQSFQSAIKSGSDTWKSPGETGPERKYSPETESGVVRKKIKEAIKEATYQGKTVPLNKPMKGDVKKSKVYVDPDGDGKAQKVNFGDKNMSIKKDQPARKKSYCARSSGQGNLNDKASANYWSRRAWNCEETQIDEISRYKAKLYVDKAEFDKKDRSKGISLARKKLMLGSKAKVPANEETVDESWSTAPQRRSFTLGKRDAEATPEQRAKVKSVIDNMKVPGPKGESPEEKAARIARNKARQMAAIGLGEKTIEEGATTSFIVKHKNSGEVKSTHNSYEEAKKVHNDIENKKAYGIFKSVKKDPVLANRTIKELTVPAGTTGKRTSVSTPMVAVRMASGKIEKRPPGKSGSSGGGDE